MNLFAKLSTLTTMLSTTTATATTTTNDAARGRRRAARASSPAAAALFLVACIACAAGGAHRAAAQNIPAIRLNQAVAASRRTNATIADKHDLRVVGRYDTNTDVLTSVGRNNNTNGAGRGAGGAGGGLWVKARTPLPRTDLNAKRPTTDGRAFINPEAIAPDAPLPEYAFEGPSTAANKNNLWCMGVKISIDAEPSFNSAVGNLRKLEQIPIESLHDTEKCDLEGCSWIKANRDIAGFTEHISEYTIPETEYGGFFAGGGDLKNFVTKMTAGAGEIAAPTVTRVEPATDVEGTSFVVEINEEDPDNPGDTITVRTDNFIIEPRENVIGGILKEHPCEEYETLCHHKPSSLCTGTDTCPDADDVLTTGTCTCTWVYYTINEVRIAESPLVGFHSVDFGAIALGIENAVGDVEVVSVGDISLAVGMELTFIGHFIEQKPTVRGPTTTGIFFVREDDGPAIPAPPVVSPAVAVAGVAIYEGPITWIVPYDNPSTPTLYIMGCPVLVHPDFEFQGPTIAFHSVEVAPLTGKTIGDLMDRGANRGADLVDIFTATAKCSAIVTDIAAAPGEYTLTDCVLELAENVLIYPDVSCANCAKIPAGKNGYLRLFPRAKTDGGFYFQLKARLSNDVHFPGEWKDVGGVAIDFDAVSLEEALTQLDTGVGLNGYYVVNSVNKDNCAADTETCICAGTVGTCTDAKGVSTTTGGTCTCNNGKGQSAGEFKIVAAETSYHPPGTVRVGRYNLRYAPADGSVRMVVRGQYRTMDGSAADGDVKLSLVHDSIGAGAYSTSNLITAEDATTADATGYPGKTSSTTSYFCEGGEECEDCGVECLDEDEADQDECLADCAANDCADRCAVPCDPLLDEATGAATDICTFRFKDLRIDGIFVDGVDGVPPDLEFQYFNNVFEIEVTHIASNKSQKIHPGRARLI